MTTTCPAAKLADPRNAAHVAMGVQQHIDLLTRAGRPVPPDVIDIAEWLKAVMSGQTDHEHRCRCQGEPVAYLSLTEAAARLGVSYRTVRRRVADGTLPVTVAGRPRIPVAALERFAA